MSIADLDVRYGAERLQTVWETLRSRDASTIEVLCRDKGGTVFPAEWTTMVRDPASRDMLVFLRDLRRQDRGEGDRGESEERYRQLVEYANDGLCIVQDEVLQFVNMAFARMLGWLPEDLVGRDRTAIVPADEVAVLRERFNRRMAGDDSPGRFETRFVHRDGRIICAEYTGRVLQNHGRPSVMMIVRDITERKQAEAFARVQSDMGVALSRCTDLNAALQIVVDSAVLVPGLDAAGAYLWDRAKGGIRLACHRGVSREFAEGNRHYSEHSAEAEVATEPRTICSQASDQEGAFREAALREGLRGVAAVPLFHEGRLVASLRVASRTQERISSEALRAVETIAATAGGAIARLRAENLLGVERDLAVSLSRTAELREALQLVLGAMSQFEEFGSRGAYVVNPVGGELCLVYCEGVEEELVSHLTVFGADGAAVGQLRAGGPIYGSPRERLAEAGDVLEQGGYRAVAVVPVTHDGQLVAALTLASKVREDVPSDVRNAIEALAAQAGGAIARLRAEDIARGSRERLRAIADHTFNWETWAGPDGRLIWVSPAVEAITGYSVEECQAMPDYPAPLILEEDRAEVMRWYKLATTGELGQDLSFRIQRKDGSVAWGSVSWHPIYDQKGRFLGHRSCVADITARREAERLARQRQIELTHAARVSTVGEMASGIAHEVNQPLGAICSYADACRRLLQEGQTEAAAATVDKVIVQARRPRRSSSEFSGSFTSSPLAARSSISMS